jgi:hypothetical protein
VQGALELIDKLAEWLMKLTNMPAVAMTPKAGAHGELCGMVAIRAAHEARERRAPRGAGAGIGAWHQPGDGGLLWLSRWRTSRQRARPGRQRRADRWPGWAPRMWRR